MKLFLVAMALCHGVDSVSLRRIPKNQQKFRKNFSTDLSIKDKMPGFWKVRSHDETYFPILGNATKNVALTHVAFSVGKPTLPPTFEEFSTTGSNSGIVSTENLKIGRSTSSARKRKNTKGKRMRKRRGKRTHKHRHGHRLSGNGRSRRRRSHDDDVRYGTPMSACTSISDWVRIHESTNMWGHRVTVLPYIEVGGRRVDQYIYETVCVDAGESCVGTDRRHFRSECVTKKIYSYAFIRNDAGEEDWSLIEINGSCNCKLERKHRSAPRSLLDHLSSATDQS